MKYTIGIDYGTLSGRAILAEVSTGRVVASAVFEYPHGVMDTSLPDGTPLPPNWALQHPSDYLQVLTETIPPLLAGMDPEDVIAIGVDFTSSTMLPLDEAGVPLCFQEAFRGNPHAYPKLWKHHAAQDQASRMTSLALERKEPWIGYYGNKISCEYALPKLWEVVEEAPQITAAMSHWMEAGDWIVWQLCGKKTQSACAAGFKAFWQKGSGFPSRDYFLQLDPRLAEAVEKLMSSPVIPVFSKAGPLTGAMAEHLGLKPGITVAASMVDAHAFIPAAGITRPGQILAILGTSSGYLALSDSPKTIPGISSAAEDGLLPGFWGYDAGQNCVGDHFAWVADRITPENYQQEARCRGISVQQYLTELAQVQIPGAHGLVALDWWNGNRSILMDGDLTGLILGITLRTRAEDIYRALIEATAYGARTIIDNYRAGGIHSDILYATGGICQKNPMMMQIYADVLNMPISLVDTSQGGALGSAIIAASAAGKESGGYDTAEEAIRAMGAPLGKTYLPIPENVAVYEELYKIYRTVHDHFGKDSSLMHKLGNIRRTQLHLD